MSLTSTFNHETFYLLSIDTVELFSGPHLQKDKPQEVEKESRTCNSPNSMLSVFS